MSDEIVTNEEQEVIETQEEENEELDEIAKKDQEIEKWKGRYKSAMKKKQEEWGGDDRDVDTIVEEKLKQREITSRVEDITDQVPEQYREKFTQEFNELSEGKTLTLENVDKLIKSALALSVPSDSNEYESIKATAMSNWPRGATKSFKKKTDPNVDYSNQLLERMWVL